MAVIMHTVLTTEDVANAERLEYLGETLSPAEPYVEGGESLLDGAIDVGTLGAVNLLRIVSRCAARHGLRRSSRSDPEDYRLSLFMDTPTMLTHNERQTELSPGDMVLFDVSRPYDAWNHPGKAGLLHFIFPRKQMRLPPASVDKLVGVRLSGRSGIGALLHTFAAQAARDLDTYDLTDAAHVSTVLLDLVGGVLAHHLDAAGQLPVESRQQVMLQRVHQFIQQRLGDPDLTPAMVAEAHHISIRTLHRLFESSGCTLAEWIRTQRLEHCRRDLSDPLLGDRPIHAIARRWGFTSHAHFTRAFRIAYGLSPQEHRHQRR
ncbi:helix-turn-helix domain-containing protein [Actinoallomurus soli]|uniref:helix-turn-helix domain-containing protein n=1 Tax=Actinoallomurus soli TaxID=2952535 RepID=UPI0020921553|nr:helix-turn-helix domain-containing protein [Actinoallomurus soli]MCO5973703.1 helix-turn-helix domain-containing protein [Actinoallomurus soli]